MKTSRLAEVSETSTVGDDWWGVVDDGVGHFGIIPELLASVDIALDRHVVVVEPLWILPAGVAESITGLR